MCKHENILFKAQGEGLHIFGLRGDHRVRVRVVREISSLSSVKDVVFLATKANDSRHAATELVPFLTPESSVVSLQNGICEDVLGHGTRVRHRVIGCVVGWAPQCTARENWK